MVLSAQFEPNLSRHGDCSRPKTVLRPHPMSTHLLGKSVRRLAQFGLAATFALAVGACGDDDDDPGAAVAAACSSSCNTTAGQCNLPAVTASNCATVCDLGYVLAPACGGPYQAYVACAGTQPLLACNGSSVTVQVRVPCLNELTNYLACAVTSIKVCVDLPLSDGACVQAKLGNQAQACVGAPAGCSLLDGTLQAGGAGVFCCA
jgi:hypothetical protein